MNNNWTDGYVAEIGYTYGFYRELTPALIQYTMLSHGYMPPALEGNYTYCELGFGQGLATNLLACANPRGQFWGTDFNPEHAAFARQLAKQSANNAMLFDDSFEEFLERDTPPFDIIVLHGTWSWVSKQAQQAIVQILRKKLKIGGAVYISYNILPGWIQEMPLRDLMMLNMDLSAPAGHPIADRIGHAIDFIDELQTSGARYFSANPRIKNFVNDCKEDDRHYLAHEYFNRSWDIIYFSDLAKQFEAAKLNFACSAHQMDLLGVLDHRGGIKQLLDRTDNPIFKQVVRDFALNRRFRRDIFTRGARRLSNHEAGEYLMDVQFLLQSPPEDVPTKVCGPENEVPLDENVYCPLVEVLASNIQPKALRELAQNPRVAHISRPELLQAIKIMVALRHVHPVFAADEAMRKQGHTRRFNEAVMNQARFDNHLKFLASPVLTGAVSINRFQLLFLLARQQKRKTPGEWAQFAYEAATAIDPNLQIQGKILNTPEEGLAEFQQRAEYFARNELPMLQALGIA